jgi:O-antigen ligase
LIAALLRKENVYVFTSALLAALVILFLTLGQETWFRLPLQVQRSLSYLPGRWDWEVRSNFQHGIDPFRQELRDLAWKNIRDHPIVGQGYAVNARELYGMSRLATNLSEFGIMVMALGSSWHNTWLGIWADFGLPAVLFWAVFWIQAIRTGFRVYQGSKHGTASRTLGLMILLYFIGDILRSWTSGHSADDPFTRWWMYGVILSLATGLQTQQSPRIRKIASKEPRFEAAGHAQTLGLTVRNR